MASDDPNAPPPNAEAPSAAPAPAAAAAPDAKPAEPNPLDDVKKGLGLLFRAAKTAVDRLPTEKIEEVTDKIEHTVTTGAREVGRAFESVAGELQSQFAKATKKSAPPPAPDAHAAPPAAPPPGTEPPAGGPRVDDGYAPGSGPTRR